ncbi:MAG TPA: copper chaperone PCu(A)C [Rhizobiaceae bacterium]|nr:copper chaperone PCu(A)C [Rhizobiaceae bacterium]
MLSLPSATARIPAFPFGPSRPIEERLGIFVFALFLLLAMTHGLWAQDFRAGDVEIARPWSRAAPEGAKVAAGYVVLKNQGSAADRLVAVTAEIARKAEIHEMAVDDKGVMTMRPLAGGLEIPPGREVGLEPGSVHIMFMGLERAPKQGETFKGTLTFEKAGAVDVEFSVDSMAHKQMDYNSHGG